jgi:translation initiation factor 2 subunit 1
MGVKEWPESGEFVICTVERVKDFVAFVELDEYKKEGLIPLSEVASGWIKHIRDHVREGQKIVCKVLSVDKRRAHIDLSLKDVNKYQRKAKIKAWKNEEKARKWMDFIAVSDSEMEKIRDGLLEAYGSVHIAFENAAMHGMETLMNAGIDEMYARKIYKIAKENVKIPRVEITGYLYLTCPLPDGIDRIKTVLNAAMKSDDEAEIKISYAGAPRYKIHITAPDYKKAEASLKKSSEAAIAKIKEFNGVGEFHRHLDG